MAIDNGALISLKDDQWLKRQKYAGDVVAKVHQHISKMIQGNAKLTTKEIESFAYDYIISNHCEATFYKYKGFPGKICISINKVLVHGFANDYILQPGDIVKIDVGATFEGAIADCAFTYMYGKPKTPEIAKLLISCQAALNKSIEEVEVGKRIGVIGSVIFNEGVKNGFGVITVYGGHGLDYNTLHTNPFIPNKSKINEGIMIEPGLSIAIEPMFVLGNNTNTKVDRDGWSVFSAGLGAHYEHSLTLDKNGEKHIITNHKLDIKEMLL